MINMCDAEKIIEVDRRVLLYYKYDFDTVDCVKVLRNKHRTRLNIRFLQVITYQSYPGGHGPLTSQKLHQKLDRICNLINLLIYAIFHIFSDGLIWYEPNAKLAHLLKSILPTLLDRKSTRLNSSHLVISYAVFCLKKKKKKKKHK